MKHGSVTADAKRDCAPAAPTGRFCALMARFALVLILVLSVSARAGDAFDERVERAKALEDTPAGQAYQDAMWPKVQPFLQTLMEKCAVPDNRRADLRSFVFVGTLSSEGELTEIEVRPITEVSTCFAHGMTRAPFPKPPASLGAGGMPITFNMRLHEMN